MLVHAPNRSRKRSRPPTGRAVRSVRAGFTLLELLMVMAIIGILSSMAAPRFGAVVEDARVARAIGELSAIEMEIQQYLIMENGLPESLDEIGRGGMLDPWGNPYQYLCLEDSSGGGGGGPGGGGGEGGSGSGGCGGVGQARKDRFLVPLNTDFDLYSMGADGQSRPPLTAAASADDVIRANDGGYIGLASEY